MTKYETFVTNYHRYQYAPRTLSEATRDATYASAIHYPPPTHKTASETLLSVLIVLGSVGVLGYMLSSYLEAIPK
jgi:hypothetical protein